MSDQVIYTVGGTVQAGGGIYISREADEELLWLCRKGEFCYVLTARQLGKSSLMVATRERLAAEDIRSVEIDLTKVGTEISGLTAEQWYLGLIQFIVDQLDLDMDYIAWWDERARLGSTHRLSQFLRQIVLEQVPDPVVIFIDEIDSTLNLDFTDDFFAAIRACYNARASDPAFKRLSFVLLGVATPGDLISDPQRTPFNIGQGIDLREFRWEDAQILRQGLEAACPEQGDVIFARIFYWTNGHPYLTQKLCLAVTERGNGDWTNERVDELVERLFLSEEARKETNLKFVRDRVSSSPQRRRLLTLYRQVYEGKEFPEDERSPDQNLLKLCGLVRVEEGVLKVRNEIYRRAFNLDWIKANIPIDEFFFVAGGTLRPDHPSYVKRPADDELLNLTLAGEFCYVLSPHQMGKSSLMVRAARRLQGYGASTAIIDLTMVGTSVTADQWYLGLIDRLKRQLNLTVEADAWWVEQASLSPVRRFTDFLRDVVLRETEGPVVMFIDEIDSTLKLDFTDDFFAAIRACYNARASDPAFKRLSFVLLGVATPGDLISDPQRTPFNIGQGIDLREFRWEDAQILRQGLEAACPEQGDVIFARIFYWTNGHPYLTQKLCLTVAEAGYERWTDDRVDELVERLFLSEDALRETNLQLVRDRVSSSPQRRRLLTLYRQVYEGKEFPEDERSPDQNCLKLCGLVRAERGVLKVRNEVYRQAFNLAWIKANTPVNWMRCIAVILMLLVFLLLASVIGFSIYQQRQQISEVQAQAFVENFQNTTSADVRITSLAGLFELSGYGDLARQLFCGELSPEEQRSLFEKANPHAVGTQLVAVIKELYMELESSEQENQLLEAMVQSLRELDDPMVVNLTAEIEQWLQGREAYAQGEYEQAVIAYSVAISLNDANPATHFDRAIAYASLGRYEEALADFEETLRLDEERASIIDKAIRSSGALYDALTANRAQYLELAAFIPTPTPTSTFTPIPTPTSTLTPIVLYTREPVPMGTPAVTVPPQVTDTATPTHIPTHAGKIAFPVFDTRRGTYDIFIANADGTGRKKIKEEASQPCLSPDGNEITYRSWRSGKRGLIVAHTFGDDIWTITDRHEASRPSVSRRGTAFHCKEPDRPVHIYLTRSGGPEAIRYGDQLHPISGESPAWVSGERLVYKGCVEANCGLYLTEGVYDGTGLTQLTYDTSDTDPEASPDGEKVAFMSQRDGNWEIYAMDLNTHTVTRLTNNGANDGLPIWSPDGRTIAFASDRGGEWAIWAMNPDGSNQQMLFALEDALHGYVRDAPMHEIGGWEEERLSWSP